MDTTERFDAYYFGRMEASEIAAFKKELQSDAELREAFKAYKLTAKLTKLRSPESTLAQVKKELQQEGFFDKIAREESEAIAVKVPVEMVAESRGGYVRLKKAFFQKTWFKVAAAILLIVCVYFLNKPDKIDYTAFDILPENELFSEQVLDEQVLGYAASKQEVRSFYEGINAFYTGKHDQTIVELSNYLESDNQEYRELAYYFLGESYRALGQYEDAIRNYEQISDSPELFNRKYMSLTLSLLELNRSSDAKATIEKVLANQDTLFSFKAKQLIKEIK